MADQSIPVSVVILTRNEADRLPACLRSLERFGEIHVLDSLSTDGTQAVAREAGCRMSEHPFTSFGQQRNHALDTLELEHGWVLFLDADERATPAFCDAVDRAVRDAPDRVAGFFCCWRMMLDGRWLKRCDHFPKWQFRLLRRGRARFRDFGHGQKEAEVDGELAFLEEPYDHLPFTRGWTDWFAKHVHYAAREAEARLAHEATWRNVFRGNPSERNQALKVKVGRSRWFPVLRFLHPYLFRLGFLEGRQGFTYCLNLAIYEYWVILRLREIVRRPVA
ncbi:MAG: glycosyltransferase family 2 protein [Opitutales bacterium]